MTTFVDDDDEIKESRKSKMENRNIVSRDKIIIWKKPNNSHALNAQLVAKKERHTSRTANKNALQTQKYF